MQSAENNNNEYGNTVAQGCAKLGRVHKMSILTNEITIEGVNGKREEAIRISAVFLSMVWWHLGEGKELPGYGGNSI